MSKHSLDVKGQLCPIPVIRTQNKVKKLAAGDILEVVCTDPGVQHDIPAWCRINGHEILNSETNDSGEIIITLKVSQE